MNLAQKLELIEELGDPIGLRELDPDLHDSEYHLVLRRDRSDLCEMALDLSDELDWWSAWQIIGCFVSLAADRGEPQQRDELVEASKLGVDAVLDVRIHQLKTQEVVS